MDLGGLISLPEEDISVRCWSIRNDAIKIPAAQIQNKEFTGAILAERNRSLRVERRSLISRGECRAAVSHRPIAARTEIAENVFALQFRNEIAAIEVPADYRRPQSAGIIENRVGGCRDRLFTGVA